MTNEEMLLQTLGTNENAKTTLSNILTEYFPSVVSELSLPDRIVEKFYDWQFPFIYTTDGAGTRKWSVSVRALCERNPKLADLDAFFNASGTDGTFQETYSGNDTETNTDNSARRTKTEFDGVGDPTSQSTADSIVVEPVDGKNTTERKTEYGKTRTYADGRTWSQILADVMDTRGPVYLFINSFAQILREPAEDPCDMPVYPPSMQMSVEVNTLSPEDPATASVTNQGTSYNAMFNLLLGIPKGATGAQGTPGADGKDGATPEIGENGNWFINGEDTGKPSRGEAGAGGSVEYMTDAEVDALFAPQDELIGTWVFNDNITTWQNGLFSLSFLSNGQSYSSMNIVAQRPPFQISYGSTAVYTSTTTTEGNWSENGYKTIQITDVSSLTNVDEFTTWLSANATKQ